MSRLWLMVVMLLGTCAVAAPQALSEKELVARGAKRLGQAEFLKRYVGNTLSGKTADGEVFHVFVATPSAFRMLYQSKKETGSWSVGPDAEFCSVVGKDKSCTREYRLGESIYSFNPDGSLAGTARIRPGNPEKL
jgi:hypothetical protein